ncbi:MAG TPA: hypothetical protein VFT19_03355 [Solirubrobacterales bacterium]|nr:hypothetical protein [Solirubrobacterales bacterium]
MEADRLARAGSHRRPAGLAAGGVLIALCLGFAPPADAISRQQAERIALRALKPPKQGLGKRFTVSIFGLPKPLGRRAFVLEGGARGPLRRSNPPLAVRRVKRLGRPQWLFWRDSMYGARFSHPSVLLLVDHRSGRVTERRRMRWWPLVNGRKPAFLRSEAGYLSRRFRIYSDLDFARRRAATSRAATAEPLGPARTSKAPPGVFAKDCLLSLHNREEEAFERDVKAMEEVAGEAGIRTFRVEGPGGGIPAGADLRRATSKVVAEGCKDVVLYITAHGGEEGSVLLGERFAGLRKGPNGKPRAFFRPAVISGAEITRAIADQALEATFKVKVDTCYSGLQLSLANLPNVLIVETASAAGEPAWSYLRGAFQLGGNRKPYYVRNRNNPRRLGEFTNRNVVGLQRFFERPEEIQHGLQQAQQQNTSFLAWALSRAFLLGENADFAATLGWTDPQLKTSFQPSPPD